MSAAVPQGGSSGPSGLKDSAGSNKSSNQLKSTGDFRTKSPGDFRSLGPGLNSPLPQPVGLKPADSFDLPERKNNLSASPRQPAPPIPVAGGLNKSPQGSGGSNPNNSNGGRPSEPIVLGGRSYYDSKEKQCSSDEVLRRPNVYDSKGSNDSYGQKQQFGSPLQKDGCQKEVCDSFENKKPCGPCPQVPCDSFDCDKSYGHSPVLPQSPSLFCGDGDVCSKKGAEKPCQLCGIVPPAKSSVKGKPSPKVSNEPLVASGPGYSQDGSDKGNEVYLNSMPAIRNSYRNSRKSSTVSYDRKETNAVLVPKEPSSPNPYKSNQDVSPYVSREYNSPVVEDEPAISEQQEGEKKPAKGFMGAIKNVLKKKK